MDQLRIAFGEHLELARACALIGELSIGEGLAVMAGCMVLLEQDLFAWTLAAEEKSCAKSCAKSSLSQTKHHGC